MPGFDNNTVYAQNVDFSGSSNVTPQVTTDGQLLIGSTVAPNIRVANIAHADGSITISNGSGTIDISGTQSTTAQKGSVTLASAAETLIATDASKVITSATLNSMMSQSDLTGFVSWGGAGPYFDDTTLGTFQILRGGTGFIKSKLITWVAQSITGLTAGNTYYIYIDSTGTIGKTSSRTDQLYIDNIVLFECLRDSTPVTNNQATVKENHPYDYSTTISNYEHDNIGTLIQNNSNGANITLNGTQAIEIDGADVLSDHGLQTVIPDSAGVGVVWNKMYTNAGGKWARQNQTNTFTGFWNNGGTPTALTAGRFGVYTLYVSKDNLNSSTPVYFAVLNTAEFANQGLANTAISNGTVSKISGELAQLELAQLGFITYRQSTAAISNVVISKKTLTSSTTTSGTNIASTVLTDTTNFNGWLSAANTNVQSSLDILDDVLKGGTAGQLVVSTGASTMPTYTTSTYPSTTGAGEMLLSNSANAVISSASMIGDFTYTSTTAGLERILTVSNTDNTNAASSATLKLTTGGASSGDSKTQYSTTTTSWSMGVDNSVTSPTADPFVISQGTALGTNNVMSIDTSGSITKPLQSAFMATNATLTDVTGDNTAYTVVFATEIFDQNSDFDGVSTFTAPVTGKYLLSFILSMSGIIATHITGLASIVTSNRTYIYDFGPFQSADGNGGLTIAETILADMDLADTAHIVLTIFNGTKVVDLAATQSNFSGVLIC